VTPATSDAHPGSFQLLLRHRRLDYLKQLVYIFSSNRLTRTVTSTVYGGTRGQVHSPAHDYAKFNNTPIITINYSSSGPRELWGFRLHVVPQLSPRPGSRWGAWRNLCVTSPQLQWSR